MTDLQEPTTTEKAEEPKGKYAFPIFCTAITYGHDRKPMACMRVLGWTDRPGKQGRCVAHTPKSAPGTRDKARRTHRHINRMKILQAKAVQKRKATPKPRPVFRIGKKYTPKPKKVQPA